MENLFIKTGTGNIPLPQKIIQKYKLEKGMVSPFSGCPIVGANNDFPSRTYAAKNSKEDTMRADTEDVTLSTSEIIDFAEGMDSHTED